MVNSVWSLWKVGNGRACEEMSVTCSCVDWWGLSDVFASWSLVWSHWRFLLFLKLQIFHMNFIYILRFLILIFAACMCFSWDCVVFLEKNLCYPPLKSTVAGNCKKNCKMWNTFTKFETNLHFGKQIYKTRNTLWVLRQIYKCQISFASPKINFQITESQQKGKNVIQNVNLSQAL